MATMKAARWHAAKDVRIEEVEVPEVQPHQVKWQLSSQGSVGRTCMNIWMDRSSSQLKNMCILVKKHRLLWDMNSLVKL